MATKKIKKKQHPHILFLICLVAIILFFLGLNFGKNLSISLPADVMPSPIPVDAVITGDPVFKETYSGVLPCADCSGLQTVLTLSREEAYQSFGTYELKEIYEGKSVEPLITKGRWILRQGTPSDSNASIYELHPDDSDEVDYYQKVTNMQLKMLGSDQKEIDSPFNYTLTKQQNVQLANPASVSCVDQGGTSEIRTDESGNEYGICNMKDGRECEEWALFRENICKAK